MRRPERFLETRAGGPIRGAAGSAAAQPASVAPIRGRAGRAARDNRRRSAAGPAAPRGTIPGGGRRGIAPTGFTLVEFLVVVGIVAVLLALLIPAIGRGREAARRINCINNLKQIALSLQSYHATHEVFPSGSVNATGPVESAPGGRPMSWFTSVLPYMEQNAVFNTINFDLGPYTVENQTSRTVTINTYNCPDAAPEGPVWSFWGLGGRDGRSSPLRIEGRSTYAGVHHDVEAPIDVNNHGVFFLNSRIAATDVSDGLSQTLFLGEIPFPSNLGWMSGTRSTLRNTGHPINRVDAGTLEGAEFPADWVAGGAKLVELERAIDAGEARVPPLFVGGFGSNHPGGSIFAFGDGSARYLKETIDPFVLRCLGNRLDGEALDDSEY